MGAIIHFKTQKERLAYLKGEFKEIVPQKVTEIKPIEVASEAKGTIPHEAGENVPTETTIASEGTGKSKKTKKKGKKKDDTVQAE